MSVLNPVRRIHKSVLDFAFKHMGLAKPDFWDAVAAHLERLDLSRRVLRSYPHELSGGMWQRACIVLANVCRPDFIIADEPTTALDVVEQQNVLAMLDDIRRSLGLSVVFVTHDMSVHANMADRIGITYAGRIVEEHPRAVHQTLAPLHRALGGEPAPHRGHQPQAGPQRPPAEPVRPADGLPLPPALPARHREVRDRGPAPRGGR